MSPTARAESRTGGATVSSARRPTARSSGGRLDGPAPLAGSPPGLSPRQHFLEGDSAAAAKAPQLWLEQDRTAPDPAGEPRPHGALDVQPLQRTAHQRPAAVVAETALVLGRRDVVPAQMRVGQLTEHAAADEAADAILLDRLSWVGA